MTGVPLAQGNGPVIPDFGPPPSSCIKNNGTFCVGWARDHWGDTFQPALIQHVKLTAIAVGIGLLIAGAAAIVAHRGRWVETPFAFVAAFLFTVPSIALFQLLIPLTGIGVTTVEIALVGYTLLIIFRNFLAGLRSVPPEVLEAARGMGLTQRQILWQVELRLALPAIITGIRIAVVTTISLATIAAFVIPQGLGAPIFDGITEEFPTKYLLAGGLAIALALIADALMVIVQRFLTPWTRVGRTT